MNERILSPQLLKLVQAAGPGYSQANPEWVKKFAELIVKDMHRKVVASILITDVVMEGKGQTPTSEDYILAINKDFGVEE